MVNSSPTKKLIELIRRRSKQDSIRFFYFYYMENHNTMKNVKRSLSLSFYYYVPILNDLGKTKVPSIFPIVHNFCHEELFYILMGKIYFQELFPGMKNIISRKNLYFQEKVISRKIPGNKDWKKKGKNAMFFIWF